MFAEYHYYDDEEDDEMGGACGTHGEVEKCMQHFDWKA